MITDHLFRTSPSAHPIARPGRNGGGRVPHGTCYWLGHCGRPRREHITAAAFRTRRGGHA